MSGRITVRGPHRRTPDGPGLRPIPLAGLNPGFALTAITVDSLLRTGYALTEDLLGEPFRVVSEEDGVERSFRGPGVRPSMVLAAVRREASGLLWLRFQVPREDWQEVASASDLAAPATRRLKGPQGANGVGAFLYGRLGRKGGGPTTATA